jgi:hypothetical protein
LPFVFEITLRFTEGLKNGGHETDRRVLDQRTDGNAHTTRSFSASRPIRHPAMLRRCSVTTVLATDSYLDISSGTYISENLKVGGIPSGPFTAIKNDGAFLALRPLLGSHEQNNFS